MLRLIYICQLIILLAMSAFAQFQMTGMVTEIYDGRTIKVTDHRGTPFTVQLRAIETPEDGQELAETVKDHLTNLLLSKQITFRFSGGTDQILVAQVLVNGLDASQQVLRDGAAWLYVDDAGSASGTEINEYRNLETLAKNEKRGVWGIADLIRPSEIKRTALNASDPLADTATAQIAYRGLGPAVEGVFGPEIYSLESGNCSGRVVGVSDGDTVTILTSANQTVKVRLAGIDAPERSQAFGMTAKQNLSNLVFGKQVSCESTKRDRYGRMIGKLSIGGMDVNLEMVRNCSAWHYKDYASEQSASDRAAYAGAQVSAQNRQCGLWADGYAVNPADYRRDRFVALFVTPVRDSSTASGGGYYTGGSSPSGGGPVRVRTYTRRDGTVVHSHTRSAPRSRP